MWVKSKLNILEVADRLGIQVNKYRKALCPFHDDKRQVYSSVKTNRYVLALAADAVRV